MPKTITFQYRNHRGVEEERTIDVDSIEFVQAPGFGYQPGWFVSGYCHKKLARRSFALSHIVLQEQPYPFKQGIYKLIIL